MSSVSKIFSMKELSSIIRRTFSINKDFGFLRSVFCSKDDFTSLFPYPVGLSNENMEILKPVNEQFEKFMTRNNQFKNEDRHGYDENFLSELKEMGAFGGTVPAEYGGLDLNNSMFARLIEILASNDLSLSVTLGAHQSIGYKGILLYGSDSIKKKYLPDLAKGKKIAAFCLTEPGTGSDAQSVSTKAVLSSDGKYWVLNGSKIWISNGGIADVFTVFAKTPTIDKKTGETKQAITAFIVERSFGGLTSGQSDEKMGIKACNTTEIFFENCKVPVENVLGEVGHGFKVAMNILNNGRFGLVSGMNGIIRELVKKSIDHANNRVQFGKKLCEFGDVQEKISNMLCLSYSTESLAYYLSALMDNKSNDYQIEAAISKIYSSESAWKVCDDSIQLHGGMGYMKEVGLEKICRDLRIFRIFEGANDILRLFVGLTGLQATGNDLKDIYSNPLKVMKLFAAYYSKGLYNFSLQSLAHPSLKNESKKVAQCIAYFGATCSKIVATHGKKIIDEQYIVKRLADSAIELAVMSATLSRASNSLNKNTLNADYEADLCRLIVDKACKNFGLNILEAIHPNESKRLIKNVSSRAFEKKAVVQINPLGL